ncbi:cellulase family glycosylhydrolase [Ochrovirga pacifica]|uniref:cellulase family glycosylhydrolase n=1 Tax=Ochrovirga pacifica TaxID=1042376 RepID=UPI00025583E7|nr:cellulase family glycosylhydrolase [Ochrovirga pacifica]
MQKIITLIIVVTTLLFASCVQKKSTPTVTNEISFLQKNEVKSPFVGHGVQWSAYPHADSDKAEWGALMTDEKWEELYKRLDFINPHIIRVMDIASWRYYQGLDKQQQPMLNFDTQEVKSLYKLLDYCQTRNIPVLFGEWGAPGLWHLDKKNKEIQRADDERWTKMIVAYLKHLILEKGYTCIQYYNLVNEPNGYWASTDGDWEQWKKGYQNLNSALKKAGLDKYVSMSGPDAVTQWENPKSPIKAKDWVLQTVDDLNEITGLYDFHIYADQHMIRDGSFVNYLEPFTAKIIPTGKPLVLGELGMKYTGALGEENKKRGQEDPYAGPDDSSMFVYDYFYGIDMADAALQSMIAGVGGAIAWDLDDAMHTVNDLGEKDQLKKWGMWNILAEEFGDLEKDKTPRPWAYSWTLLCQLFPPKSTVIVPSYTQQNDSIRAVAATFDKGHTIALVNQSSKAECLQLASDVFQSNQPLYLYEYSENHRPVNSQGFPVSSQKITKGSSENIKVDLKAKSVVFLSTRLLE